MLFRVCGARPGLMSILFASATTPALRIILFLVFVFSGSFAVAQEVATRTETEAAINNAEFLDSLIDALTHKAKEQRFAAIVSIAESNSDRKTLWLEAILSGQMYQIKKQRVLVFATKQGREYAIKNAATDEDLGTTKKRKLKKIVLDNNLRSRLRALLDAGRLNDEDPLVRLEAVTGLIGTADEAQVDVVLELREAESDSRVNAAMTELVSLYRLENGNKSQQLEALSVLDRNLNPRVLNAIRNIDETTDDAELVAQAALVVTRADARIASFRIAEKLFFGLSLGSVLVVSAIGLAITFGVMGVINMAHGELIMLGAYTTFFVQQLFPNAIDYSLLVAIPAAFAVSGLVGVLIERSVIRHLYGRPLETLLATFGISLLLQQLVRTVVSPQNVAVINPTWMSGSWVVNPALSFTLNRMVILLFCMVVFAGLLLFFSRSKFGLQIRAVSQNRKMASAMGIRSQRVDALTFGLGSGIAGIAGVALSQIGNVGPNLGQSYIIDSFMVVVFGGVGNLWGALVAGMSLGVMNKFMEPLVGAVLAKILVLVFIIQFIQWKPRGLFPQRGRAADA